LGGLLGTSVTVIDVTVTVGVSIVNSRSGVGVSHILGCGVCPLPSGVSVSIINTDVSIVLLGVLVSGTGYLAPCGLV